MTTFITLVVLGAVFILVYLYKQEKPLDFTPNQEADEDEDDDFGRPSKSDVV